MRDTACDQQTHPHHFHLHNPRQTPITLILYKIPRSKYITKPVLEQTHFHNNKKANDTNAFLMRNIRSCPQEIKATCYKALVRPIVEYASPVWDPSTRQNINMLDGVQRKAARFVTGDHKRTSSVTKILQDLQWPTLEKRRKQAKVTLLFKAIRELVEIPTNRLNPSDTGTRGHKKRYRIPHSRIESHKHSFFPSTIRLWNTLQTSTINQPDEDSFKRCLHFLNVP